MERRKGRAGEGKWGVVSEEEKKGKNRRREVGCGEWGEESEGQEKGNGVW